MVLMRNDNGMDWGCVVQIVRSDRIWVVFWIWNLWDMINDFDLSTR